MVVDAGGGSVRERERREWDTAAGLVGLSLRKPAKCKRLADNCLSSVPKARKRLTASFGSQPLAFRRFPEA